MEVEKAKYQNLKNTLLENVWGFNTFRGFQEQAIDALVSGKDVLALFPTGGGKSLCYQLPALLTEGTALVVSPLLALMKDQVSQLRKLNIEAELISSELDEADAELIYSRCREGLTKILYISPERLLNNAFIRNIETIDISFLAVDEAHCISEWGQDFRPSYQNICTFRNEYKKVPCIALTATATPQVLNEIITKLQLRNPEIFKESFKRDNIQIIVSEASDKYSAIAEYLSYNKNSGIIYARTRKETEELTEFLKRKKFENVANYHAGLSKAERNAKQRNWVNSNSNVLIATNAFGMGIDKDNVQFIIHISPPSSIENYYQEIGRAGRNGALSQAILLWNPQEMKSIDDILQNQMPSKKEFTKAIQYLYSIFQIGDLDESERMFQFNIERIKQLTKIALPKIRNILQFLHNQEVIYYNPNKTHSTLELKFSPSDFELLPKSDAYFIELLLRNLEGLSTHKAYFFESTLAKKLGTGTQILKQHLIDFRKKEYVEYIDGEQASIRFLTPRNDRSTEGKLWNLFLQIQKNKWKKWQEIKFFTEENAHCKMKMILTYFGEKNVENCGKCSVCTNKKDHFFSTGIEDQLLQLLQNKPSTLEEIFVKMNLHKKEKVRESIILLLDAGKIKMLDFRTYTV